MEDNTIYIAVGFTLFAAVFWWFVKKGERAETVETAEESTKVPNQSWANMPFEKQSVPLTKEEYRYFRNQYLILMVLPVMFVGLFGLTWYYNPPANNREWVYMIATAGGILVASYFILKYRARTNVMKLVIRGVVCEKKRIRKGKYTSFSLTVGDTTMTVSRGDFEKYQLGDVVSMERIEDKVFTRGRIRFIGKTQH